MTTSEASVQSIAKLKFKVAPHIVEDLGLNLYTSLPRVLVEFVANAHDADSPTVTIDFDKEKIDAARGILKKEYELELARASGDASRLLPLGSRTLPSNLSITIQDAGFGMSRADLATKFLYAGRRRRLEEPEAKGRTPGGRLLMGRKGLGKLAGFGVGKQVQVISRKKGESHATEITLRFEDLVKSRVVDEVDIPERRLDDGGGITPHGTKIVLSDLLYDPLKSRAQTIEDELAEHFELVNAVDFEMRLNGAIVSPSRREHVFAWPDPATPIEQLVHKELEREDGGKIEFTYRIRFTGKDQALPATRRGVRVYAHNRLASAPSLLAADTNMHGFRMTDYLDGVVCADFLDDQLADYIATDRQSLRWESPLLSPLHEFLSSEIKEACKAYQRKRDEDAPREVESDAFTKDQIDRLNLSGRDKRLAYRIATILEGQFKSGVKDPAYRSRLVPLLQSVGHGKVLTAIAELASHDHPDLGRVAQELTRLTRDELEQFIGSVRGRLNGIEALEKIVRNVDFKAKNNERVLQRLFEDNPWLLDPTYSQFLSADSKMSDVFDRLAKELKIGKYAPAGSELHDKRPDLVFLLGNVGVRLVIVELKSANKHLEAEHLSQLELYMSDAAEWLAEHGYAGLVVDGHLLGSRASPQSRADGVRSLRSREKQAGPNTRWKVRDYLEVLTDTKNVHRNLLRANESEDESKE